MEKILPLINPPIETYQGTSFILGVLMAYKNTRNLYYNNYINLGCNKCEDIQRIGLDFTNITWEDYRLSGIAEMNLYKIKNISRKNFEGFIKERIDQGNYILLYRVDEFYLSYSLFYHNTHYMHDTYVYGYKENYVSILAYTNMKLIRLELPIIELEESIYWNDDISFCTFRPNMTVNVEINLKKIKKFAYEYVKAKEKNDKVYGVRIYDILINIIEGFVNRNIKGISNIDLRPFRLLWEHKKVWKDRINKISGYYVMCESLYKKCEEIEMLSHLVFTLSIKYNLENNNLILERIINYLKNIKVKDIEFIYSFLNFIDTIVERE